MFFIAFFGIQDKDKYMVANNVTCPEVGVGRMYPQAKQVFHVFSSRYRWNVGILQKPLAAAVHMNWIGPLAVSLRKTPIQKSKRKTCGAPRAVCPLNSAQIAGLMCRQSLSIVPTAA